MPCFNPILTYSNLSLTYKKNTFASMKTKFSNINLIDGMPMKKNLLFYSFFMLFFFVENASAQKNYNALIFEGNEDFKSEKYDQASSKYMDAIQQNSKDFAAHYNLGNSLYKKKQYDEANAEYKKAEALAKNNTDKMASLYNQGNVAMQQQQPEQAAEIYKKALKLDPYNEAARKNFEIAKLKSQEKQDQKEKNNPNNQKGKDGKEPKEGDENGDSPENSSGGNQKEQQGQGKGSDEKQEGKQSGMPKELRDAIMNEVGNREKRTTKRILNKNAYSIPESNEKDW